MHLIWLELMQIYVPADLPRTISNAAPGGSDAGVIGSVPSASTANNNPVSTSNPNDISSSSSNMDNNAISSQTRSRSPSPQRRNMHFRLDDGLD